MGTDAVINPRTISTHVAPQAGASLLLAFKPPPSNSTQELQSRRTVLIIGQHRLTAVRAFSCLEAGLRVVVGQNVRQTMDAEILARIASNEIIAINLPDFEVKTATASLAEESEKDLFRWSRWLHNLPQEILDDISLVCITDTIPSNALSHRSPLSAMAIRGACYKLRIPVNVADHPHLSDFNFPTSYRFPLLSTSASQTIQSSPLQLAITTNANSCRLATRIRREVVSRLPKGVGSAVAKIGQLRESVRSLDETIHSSILAYEGDREEGWTSIALNDPVPQILQSLKRSHCTSSKRFLGVTVPVEGLPLTPPSTPPLSDMVDKMEPKKSEHVPAALQGKLNNLTRMRFIAQICRFM